MSDFYTNLGQTKMVPVFLATLTAWLTCDIWAEWTECDVAEALLPAMVVVMVVVVLGCGSDEVVVVEGGWWGELPRLARVAVRASSESCLSCWAPSEEGLEGGMRVRFDHARRPLVSLQLEQTLSTSMKSLTVHFKHLTVIYWKCNASRSFVKKL